MPIRRIRQRFLHFYFLNEAIALVTLAWLYSTTWELPLIGTSHALISFTSHYTSQHLPCSLPKLLAVLLLFGLWSLAFGSLMFAILVVRRCFRPAHHRRNITARYPQPVFESRRIRTRDGAVLQARVCWGTADPHTAGAGGAGGKGGCKVMLLAAPLGQCGPGIYAPITTRFGPAFTYVTWDYRGFFGSGLPTRGEGAKEGRRGQGEQGQQGRGERVREEEELSLRPQSLDRHARDAVDVLQGFGISFCDVGVAVALEVALSYPSRVGALVLLNGLYGSCFRTAFQPLFRVPLAGDLVAYAIDFCLQHPWLLDPLRRGVLTPLFEVAVPIYCAVFGSPMLTETLGKDYLLDFLRLYMGNLCRSDSNVVSWFRMFQELDANSVYHLLPLLKHHTLIISGFLDVLTPAMNSVEMARQMPHAEHYCDPLSSHMSILESPESCMAEIEDFLQRQHLLSTQHDTDTGTAAATGGASTVSTSWDKKKERRGHGRPIGGRHNAGNINKWEGTATTASSSASASWPSAASPNVRRSPRLLANKRKKVWLTD